MFFNRTKIKKDMIPNIRPTSKAALKISCLYASNGDVDKAAKLYEYMSKDMDDLPTFEAPQPSAIQQIKDGAAQTFSWLNENQDTIMNWVGFFKNMLNKGGAAAIEPTGNALPPINSK